MRVYHLTVAHFGLSDLALRRVKVARFEDLNDPFELLGAYVRNKDFRTAFQERKKQTNNSQGLICFSKSWSNPLLWGHYAEKHTGMCLGFDVPDRRLEPVIYAEGLLKIETEPKTKKPVLTAEVLNELLRTKFSDWKYEDEMRWLIDLKHATAESGKYFYSFSEDLILREVILGPRCELPIERIRSLVEGDTPPVVVRRSRIAFTRYKIVEDRSARRSARRP